MFHDKFKVTRVLILGNLREYHHMWYIAKN